MANPIRLRRGPEAGMPTLGVGEPAFTTDTKKLFIGSSTGNILIATAEPVESTEVSWNDVQDKPAQFAPAAHTHLMADVTGLLEKMKELDFILKFLGSKHVAQATGFIESPAQGPVSVPANESFVMTIRADGQNVAELEVDHSLSNILPEFSVYASEENPYGSDEDRAQFEAAGVNVAYSAVSEEWTIDFGTAVTNAFKSQANVRFYFVAKDVFGKEVYGSMSPTTPENTRTYQIS